MTEILVNDKSDNSTEINERATGTYADIFGEKAAAAYFDSVTEAREANLRIASRVIKAAKARRPKALRSVLL